jgi:hypothetical protein
MLTFAATTGDVTLPYAQFWTAEQWAFMAEQARINPLLAPTVSGAGIRTLAGRVANGEKLSEYEISVWLGGFWTGPIETKTTVTLEEGEVLTPNGLIGPNYTGPAPLPPAPPPTISGAIPPGPTSNVFPAPTTIPVDSITTVPAVTATGGQTSVGTAVPEIKTASAAPTMPNVPQWVWLLAIVGAIYFFVQEQ